MQCENASTFAKCCFYSDSLTFLLKSYAKYSFKNDHGKLAVEKCEKRHKHRASMGAACIVIM